MKSSPLRILVHEFVTGGGWQGEDPSGLAPEGLAMLQAVLDDFHAWERAQVVTTLDERLTGLPLTAHRIVHVNYKDYLAALRELASEVDAVLLIAPESDDILTNLTTLVEETGTPLLGSNSTGVAIASDKWECFRRLKTGGLYTPDTWRTNRAEAALTAGRLGFPLVVKPIGRVGCEGVSLVPGLSSLERALDLVDPADDYLLLQRYVAGTHASVSLLASSTGILPLSLNEQAVGVGTPFSYHGGTTPLSHPLAQHALDFARRAVSLVPGLRGYVGVDMVLTGDRAFVIEINPRVTASYVGLRRVIDINLAEALWQACIEDTLPRTVTLSGEASFRKEDFHVVQHA